MISWLKNNLLEYSAIAIVAFGIGICIGYSRGSSSERLKHVSEANKQIVVNAKGNGKTNTALAVESVKIIYKTKIIKEFIHDKENSNIDVDIPAYWVQLYNASTSESQSSTIPDESSTPVRISTVTKVSVDNNADCLYDKERVRQFQQFVITNGFETESN